MESLSHFDFTETLERLAARNWRREPVRRCKSLDVAQIRRRFAEVDDAVVQVLAEARGELRMGEVHAAVEELLGQPVSRSSVKNCLARGTQRRNRRIERVSRGRYRLFLSNPGRDAHPRYWADLDFRSRADVESPSSLGGLDSG
jgi:hypothetical protein